MILRHGDVMLVKIDQLPKKETLKRKADNVLEYGEVSGHSHQLVGPEGAITVYSDTETEQTADYVVIDADQLTAPGETVKLIHEEHNTIELEPAVYEVRRQRELNPYDQAVRQVMD
jgi:hypothetical protein